MNKPFPRFKKPPLQTGLSFVRDLGFAIAESPELRFLLYPNPDDRPKRSEFSYGSYEDPQEVFSAFVEAAVPAVPRRKPYTRSIISSEGLKAPYEGEMWLYINGVATSHAVLKANGKELARIFQRPIHLVHNPTDGLVLDLCECILGRTFDFKTGLEQYVLDVITRALIGYSKVVVIAHSQGGIVAANVANELVKHLEDRSLLKNLEIYTFASAADEMLADRKLSRQADQCVPYYEHFANGRDFVARFGVINCKDGIDGELFVEEGRTGHLLNAHYLPAFERGAYCAGKSRLFEYIGGRQPRDLFRQRPQLVEEPDLFYSAA